MRVFVVNHFEDYEYGEELVGAFTSWYRAARAAVKHRRVVRSRRGEYFDKTAHHWWIHRFNVDEEYYGVVEA